MQMPEHEVIEGEVIQDEVTQGLKSALGQFTDTVSIADAKSAAAGNRNKTIDVTIRKLKGRQFAGIFECINKLVQRGVVRLQDDSGNFILTAKGFLTEFRETSAILRGGQPVLDMIAIACDLPQQHVDNLDLLDLAKLLGKQWEVQERFFEENQTEFKQALGPIWMLVEKLTEKKSSPAESSPDSSTSSSAEDTEPSEK
jgi:hypothetical protein